MTENLSVTGKTIIVFLLGLITCVNTTGQYRPPTFCEITPSWDKISVNKGPVPEGSARIFFISNRPYIPDDKKGVLFPNDIADYRKVSYFIVTCNGTEWQLTIVPDFQSGMKEINDGRNMLLFIEGHGKTLPMTLNRAFQVQQRYDVALVVFDWPSQHSNFNKSLARVRRCGDNFFNLLLQIKDYRASYMTENQNFSIICHSLGNYFISNFVVCGDWQYLNEKIIDNIIMNAAAIRTREHGEVLSKIGYAERLYITSNKNDFVLRGAHLLTSGKMLGNLVIKPMATNAHYLNFTDVAGREHSYYFGYHGFEHTNPAVWDFYNTAVQGREVNLDNAAFYSPRATGDGYDIRPDAKR
ncbi:MAG TPA: alpha/beta hydrolase [Bacteroidales bacterium]|nr:alpha/beta hydrolase [Bacteroidales bacterium]